MTQVRLTNFGETPNPDGCEISQSSTLTLVDSNYILHIPEAISDDGISYQIDLIYLPTTDGLIWFIVSGVWEN